MGQADLTAILKTIKLNSKQTETIAIPVQHGFEFYPVKKIIRCEADTNYTRLYMLDLSPVLVSKPIKALEELLDGNNFFRPHQSHLINLDHIKRYIRSDGGEITMCDDSIVPISRQRKAMFLSLIRKYYEGK